MDLSLFRFCPPAFLWNSMYAQNYWWCKLKSVLEVGTGTSMFHQSSIYSCCRCSWLLWFTAFGALANTDPEAAKLTEDFSSNYFDMCFSEWELTSSSQEGTWKPLLVGLVPHRSAEILEAKIITLAPSPDNLCASKHQWWQCQYHHLPPNMFRSSVSPWLSRAEAHPQTFESVKTVEHNIPQQELSTIPLFQN